MPTDAETFVGELLDSDDESYIRIDAERETIIMDNAERMSYLDPEQALRLANMLREAASKARPSITVLPVVFPNG